MPSSISNKITLLNRATLECLDENSEKNILKKFTDIGIEVLGSSFGFVFMKSKKGHGFELSYKSSTTPYTPLPPRSRGTNRHVLRSKIPLFVSRMHKAGFVRSDAFPYMKSFVNIPIAYKNRTYGNIILCFKNAHKFSNEEKSLCSLLGNNTAQVITISRLYDEQKRNENRLKRAQGSAHLGSWELNLTTKKLIWSDEVYRIFGLKPREFRATYEAFLNAVHPEDREMVNSMYAKSITNGSDAYDIEHRIVRKDTGEIRFVHEKCDHLKNKDGRIVFSMGIIQDITEKKLIELEKNNFIAMMSHELRNPLATIMMGAELMRMNFEEKANNKKAEKEIKESLGIVEKQAKNMTRLLDDLLDISRISRGKVVLNKQKVNISESVRRAFYSIHLLLKEQKQTFSLFLPKKSVYVWADPLRLEQIFINLLNNAVKYTPPGGRISLKTTKEGSEVKVEVRDTGIGIDPKLIDSVFNLFVRLASPFISTQGELGIGLKLTRDLIELHGGTITAESRGKNKGSKFIVRLPMLLHPNSLKPKVSLPEEKPAKEKLRVLVVDDNKNIADMIVKTIEHLGYRAKACYDGAAAIELAQKYLPQAAFIDIGMPGMNGYEVAEELRKMEKKGAQRIKLAAVTGYGQEDYKKKSKMAGFDLHLVKPIDAKTISEALISIENDGEGNS